MCFGYTELSSNCSLKWLSENGGNVGGYALEIVSATYLLTGDRIVSLAGRDDGDYPLCLRLLILFFQD